MSIRANAKWMGRVEFAGTGPNGHPVLMDGGGQAANSPMELVLAALCGCTAYDVVTILEKKREPFTAVEVSAEAEKAAEPPRVYTNIKLLYRVSGNVSRKAVEDAVRLSEEKYCSVAAMLKTSARISWEIRLDPQ